MSSPLLPAIYGGPAIGEDVITGAVPTNDTPPAPVLLYNASYAGVTTNQIGAQFSAAGYRYLLFLGNLSAITAGSVNFRLKGVGNYYNTDIYKVTETAAGSFISQSVGPGMQTQQPILPNIYVECDVTTGPATFTVEVWGWQ